MTDSRAASPQPAASSAQPAVHAGPSIAHSRLENGMEVVVIPDHRAPVVTHMVWYRNGSAVKCVEIGRKAGGEGRALDHF